MVNPLISVTPVIFLENHEDATVSAAVLHVSVRLGNDGQCNAEVELNNWGNRNGVTDYLYFQDARLERGKALKINAGSETLFDGLISSAGAHYAQDAAPTLWLAATFKRVFASSKPIRLNYGQQLRGFEVKESWQVGRFWGLLPGKQSVSGKGLAELAGQLTPGAVVDLAGLGDKFSGRYRLSEVTHDFERVSGWRTQFTVVRED